MTKQIKMLPNQILIIEILNNGDGTVNGNFRYNNTYFKDITEVKNILGSILGNISQEMIKNGILDKPIIH